MGKYQYFSKGVTRRSLLQFPIIIGCVVFSAVFGMMNFKHLYRKEIEEGREQHVKFADEMYRRSINNRTNKSEETKKE